MAGPNHLHDVVWMDDQRILFVGVKTPYSEEKPALWIWNIDEGFERYKPIVRSICYSEGIISYTAYKTPMYKKGEATYFYGNFREEKVTQFPKNGYFDRINCSILDERPGKKNKYGRGRLLLKDGYGVLDVGPGDMKNKRIPIYFSKDEASEPILMPFYIHQISSSQKRYYPFKDAHLLYGNYDNQNYYIENKSIDDAPPQKLWWLYKDGNVEEFTIPPGPWLLGGYTYIRAVRGGIFLVYFGNAKVEGWGGQGGYLIQGEKATKVIDGYLYGATTAPDGCRVAVSQAPGEEHSKYERQKKQTLKIIDFCNTRENKDD